MSQAQNDDPRHPSTGEDEPKDVHQADPRDTPKKPLRPDRKTRPTEPYRVSEAGGPLPELDEGPRPTAVDDIQAALFEAERQGGPAEVDFDQLPGPQPDFDQPPARPDQEAGPESPEDEDDILRALQAARQEGVSPEVSFEDLPRPRPYPQKKISRPVKPISPPQSQVDTEPVRRAEPPAPTKDEETEAIPPSGGPGGLHSGPKPEPVAEPPAPESSAVSGVQSGLWTPETEASSPEPAPEPEPEPVIAVTETTATDFGLLLALFVSFRLLTLFLLKPGGFIRDWSDFDTYLGIASLSDFSLYPFVDFWLEWPPLVPWLAVGVYRLSLLFPPWPDDPRLWFILLLGGVFLLFEIGNFVLIHRLARRLFADTATRTRVLWLYAGLFPPIYAMLGFFDGVALFFILLTLELLLANQRFPAAIATGVGFLVKIIPALMLPVAVRTIWDQHRQNRQEAGVELGLYAVAFGLTVVILLLPLLIVGPEWVVTSARSMAGRSAWETVWAVAEGYYGFGAVAGERLNPNETAFAIYPSRLPVWFWPLVTLVFAAIYAFLFSRPADYRQPRNVIAFGGITVALFMLYSKGYSPQFLVYLLPFILLLLPNGRGLAYALMLTGLNFLEQPLYFVLLPQTHWLLIFIVVARFALVTVLLLEFAAVLWPEAVWVRPTVTLQKRAVPVYAGLSALALVVLAPLLFRAYAANRMSDDNPVSTLAGFMAAQAAQAGTINSCQPDEGAARLLLSDQTTYRDLYAPLNGDFELLLTAGAPEQSNFPAPSALIPTSGSAWVLPTGPQARALQTAAINRGRSTAAFTFDGLGTLSLFDFSATNRPDCSAPARFRADIELLTHQVEVSGGGVNVTLYWRVLAEQRQSLTVFTQILNAEGQQVAGHDSVPRNGTFPMTEWPVETVQVDHHRIDLPSNLPPGQYTIIAGLYNTFSERLPVTTADGSIYPNRAVPLATVELP